MEKLMRKKIKKVYIINYKKINNPKTDGNGKMDSIDNNKKK